jgi:hypothetical protein
MNLGAFFAAMLALGPSEPTFNAELPVNQPRAVAHTTLVAAPVQLAALPPDSETTTTPPAAPPAPPKVKPPQTTVKKGTPATKPGTATAQRKPTAPRKATAGAKPNGGAKTTAAATCPAGSVKSPSTGRCTPRIKSATPPA